MCTQGRWQSCGCPKLPREAGENWRKSPSSSKHVAEGDEEEAEAMFGSTIPCRVAVKLLVLEPALPER